MKTNLMSRVYAFAVSAVFATVATLGIAVMMTSSGENARTVFNSSATAQPATANLDL